MTPDEKVLEAVRALQSLEARDMDLCTQSNLAQLLYFMDDKGASARMKLWGRLSCRVEAVEMVRFPPGFVGPPPEGTDSATPCLLCPECGMPMGSMIDDHKEAWFCPSCGYKEGQ